MDEHYLWGHASSLVPLSPHILVDGRPLCIVRDHKSGIGGAGHGVFARVFLVVLGIVCGMSRATGVCRRGSPHQSRYPDRFPLCLCFRLRLSPIAASHIHHI